MYTSARPGGLRQVEEADDIESSTRLRLDLPEVATSVIELHDEIITSTFEGHGNGWSSASVRIADHSDDPNA